MEKKDDVLGPDHELPELQTPLSVSKSGSSDDDIEALHKSIEFYAKKYKDIYRCCVFIDGIEDYHTSDMSKGIPTLEDVIRRVRLDREADYNTSIIYAFIPKHFRRIRSEYNISVRMSSSTFVYIQQYYDGHDASARQVIEDRSREFQKHSELPFGISAGYPDEVILGVETPDPEEFFRKTFSSYHETLYERLTPRLNLHMAYDSGFLADVPYEIKALIMDKIDVGHLSYHPGQLSSYGLHALGF